MAGIGCIEAGLEQGLPDPLCRAAVQLPLDDPRIDDASKVIDRPVANERDAARFLVDLDLAQMRAVAERKVWRIIGGGCFQTRLEACQRKVMRDMRRARDGCDGAELGCSDNALSLRP